MAIPSIISATPSGNELQFVTNAGLKPVDFGVRVTDSNLITMSKLNEQNAVAVWGKQPSTLRSYDPDNSWVENWNWATDSNRDIVQTFGASDGNVYFAVDNNTHTNTRIYKIDSSGTETLLHNYGTITGSNTYGIGTFAEIGGEVHFCRRITNGHDTYVRNLTTGIDTLVVNGIAGQPSLMIMGGDLYLFFRENATTPDTRYAYKQTDKALNTWTYLGTSASTPPEVSNFYIMSTNDKFYGYTYIDGDAYYPNKLYSSTDLVTWSEVVDFGSRLPNNSRVIQNDSLHLDTTDYIVIREGTASVNDDSTAYLYYFATDKLVPLGDEYGILEQANLDNNELWGGRQTLNDLKSATSYPILKVDGLEVEYSVSAFTDTTFNVDFGATPPIGTYTLYWMDGSSSTFGGGAQGNFFLCM